MRIRTAGEWGADSEAGSIDVELRDEIDLPKDIQKMLQKVADCRRDAERLQKQSAGVLEKAIKQLSERLRLSTRDQADLLGLSHQRIHQIKQR